MIREAFDAVTSNAGLAIGAVAGAGLGAWGGSALGTGAEAVAFGAGLGAVGLAGGAMAGHLINKQMDKGRAAPMGMRVASTSIKAGAASEVTLKPSIEFAEKAAEALEAKAKADPKIKEALPELKAFSSYSKLKLQGTTNPEGTSMSVEKITLVVPGRKEPITFAVKDIKLPVKDGKIDETNPEAKAMLRKALEQGIDEVIPEGARAAAKESLTTLLSKADAPVATVPAAPGTAPVAGGGLLPTVQTPSLERLANAALGMATRAATGTPGAPGAPGVNPNGGLPLPPGTPGGPFGR